MKIVRNMMQWADDGLDVTVSRVKFSFLLWQIVKRGRGTNVSMAFLKSEVLRGYERRVTDVLLLLFLAFSCCPFAREEAPWPCAQASLVL